MAGFLPGLWKVKGGNKQVPEGLLKLSGANSIHSRVTSVNKLERGYSIQATSGGHITNKDYDIVILAAPIDRALSKIDFENFPRPVGNFSKEYHRTVATFVKAWPNHTFFGFDNFKDFPTEILTTSNKAFFNSIGRQSAIDFRPGEEPQIQDAPVYKVFSQVPLTDTQLDSLFTSIQDKAVVDWLAYPHYHSDETEMPSFKLDDRLYYANALEWAASAMETEIIGARNAALLAHNEWFGHSQKVDATFVERDSKTEL